MKPGEVKPRHMLHRLHEVARMLANGLDAKKIMKVKGKEWGVTTEHTISNYTRDAEPLALAILAKRQAAEDKIYQDRAVKEATKGILSKMERQALLTQIALGELNVTLKKSTFNTITKTFQYVPCTNPPTLTERMKAIEILNAMDGSNAPSKVQHSGGIELKKGVTDFAIEEFDEAEIIEK